MISGETEAMLARELGADYHHFLGFGKGKKKKAKKPKKELTEEERAARTERRQQFMSTLGQQMQGDSTLSNVLNMFKKKPAQPTDYTVTVGNNPAPPAPEEESSGIPIWAIVGGLTVLGVAGYLILQKMKANKQQATVPEA